MISPCDYFKQLDEDLVSTHFAVNTYFDSPDSQNNAFQKSQTKFSANPSAFCLPESEEIDSEKFEAECKSIKNYYAMREFSRKFMIRRSVCYFLFLIFIRFAAHLISESVFGKAITNRSIVWSIIEVILFIIYVGFPQQRGLGSAFIAARIISSVVRLRDRFETDISFSAEERNLLELACIGIVVEQVSIINLRPNVSSRSYNKLLLKIGLCVCLIHLANFLAMHTIVFHSTIQITSSDNLPHRNMAVYLQEVTFWSILFQLCSTLRAFFFSHKARPLSGLRIRGVQPSLLFYPEILSNASLINKVLLRNFLKALDFARYKKRIEMVTMAQRNLINCLRQLLEQLPKETENESTQKFRLALIHHFKNRCFRPEDPIVESEDFVEMDKLLKFRLL